MKAMSMLTCLRMLKNSVSREKDLVEFTGTDVKASDGVWFARVHLPERTPAVLISFNKLRKISATLPADTQVSMTQKNVNCIVKGGNNVWRLNLRDDAVPDPPEMEEYEELEIGGHELLNAITALKHLMKTELSRPGLLSSWLTPFGEMVAGDGSRLGGVKLTYAYDYAFPNSVLLEVARVLGVEVSEKVAFMNDGNNLRIRTDKYTLWAPTLSEDFEREWYTRVRGQLENEMEGGFTISCSELLDAIKAVNVTSGYNLVDLVIAPDHVNLVTRDEAGQKSVARVTCSSNFEKETIVTLDLSHLETTVVSRSAEFLTVNISEQVVEIVDDNGWEILVRKQG